MSVQATTTVGSILRSYDRRWYSLIAAAAFVVVAPHLFGGLNVSQPALSENRVLAQLPNLPESLFKIRETTKALESYIQDHFPPRAHLISLLNAGRYRLGYSTLDRVVVGQDGWLFYKGGSSIQQYLGTQPFSDGQADDWVAGFKDRASWLSSRNSKFYVLIAPQKPTVYPDKMPSWLPPSASTEIDKILSAAAARGVDQVIYPKTILKTQKAIHPVYTPYDTHWNGVGAHFAYTDLMNRISADYPDMKPLPLSDFTPSKPLDSQVPRDLALMLGVAGHIKQSWITYATWPQHDEARTLFLGDRKDWTAPQVMETDATNERTLLLIRDSFATDSLPFLKAHFRRIISVHHGDGFFRKDLVETYKPDVVLLEVIETGARHAMAPLPR